MFGSEAAGMLQKCLQEPASQPLPPSLRIHRHGGDVQLIDHQPAAGHRHQSAAIADAQAGAARILKLPFPLFRSP